MGEELESKSPYPVFRFGAYDTSIDDKNRLLVPAECRNAMDPERDGKAFFVSMGINRKLWFYPERGYTQLVSQQRQLDITPTAAELAYYQLLFANTYQREPDKQGRLVLPDRLIKRANLGKDPAEGKAPIEVTFVGVKDHWELWAREDWTKRSDDLDARMPEIVETMKQISLTSGKPSPREVQAS